MNVESTPAEVDDGAPGPGSRTLLDKIWDAHLVRRAPGEPDLLYIDLHLLHEVTSPQAFAGLRIAGRRVRRPELTVATMDHNVPTERIDRISDPQAARQMRTLEDNCAEFAVTCYPLGDPRQGIVHVMAPEQGLSRPGMTIVCGDSHTSTHGAFGALAFGIGTSEVEHVLATQTLPQVRPRTMSVIVDGELPVGTAAKDVILSMIRELGAGGGLGYVIEYRGSTITAMSMDQRMTVCNMSIEAGARAGMIAPDAVTFAYLAEHAAVPDDAAWETMLDTWRQLSTDDGARFDHELTLDATAIRPHVTWGTNPSQVTTVDGVVPDPDGFADSRQREAAHRALAYMDLRPGTPIRDVPIDVVFIGSCTNSRLSDLREAAAVLDGRHIAPNVRALVVPGSDAVKRQAELEGLDEVFRRAGFEWRHAGCSMCTAMNGDELEPGQRCASTSNRNYEGRQGKGGRTHLVSPAVAAATAVAGTIATPFDLASH